MYSDGNDSIVSEYAEYCTKYIPDFYGMEDFVAELVDSDTLEEWLAPFINKERSLWELTVLSAVTEMNIPKSAFIKSNAENGGVFTDEQTEALYSGDEAALNRAFVSPWALTANGKIFTPDWLAVHTASEYEKNGITFDALFEYIKKIDISELASFCVPIAFAMEEMNAEFDPYSIEQVENSLYPKLLYHIPDEIHASFSNEEYQRKFENFRNCFIVEGNETPQNIREFNIINICNQFSALMSFSEMIYNKLDIDSLKNVVCQINYKSEKSKLIRDTECSDPNYTIGEKEKALALITQYENYLSFLNDHGLDAITEDEYYSEEELLIVERYRERYR